MAPSIAAGTAIARMEPDPCGVADTIIGATPMMSSIHPARRGLRQPSTATGSISTKTPIARTGPWLF